jgi:hypothetical protein
VVRNASSKRTAKDSNIAVSPDFRSIVLRSRKFRDWTPERIRRKAADHNAPVVEKHFSPAELAKAWGVDSETIRNLFRSEPGVLKIGEKNPKHKRAYLTLRIPESVAVRVHRRLSE